VHHYAEEQFEKAQALCEASEAKAVKAPKVGEVTTPPPLPQLQVAVCAQRASSFFSRFNILFLCFVSRFNILFLCFGAVRKWLRRRVPDPYLPV
jgi:hypothetical protein